MIYRDAKKFGDIGEEAILERIQKKYPKAFIDDKGKANSDWDIWVPEINLGIEVKMDWESKETGNILIEVEMDNFFTALTVTKATFWVFITGYDLIWITPLEIYRFLEIHHYYGRSDITGTGDEKSKIVRLPALSRFLKYVKNLERPHGWVESIDEHDRLNYDKVIIEYKERTT